MEVHKLIATIPVWNCRMETQGEASFVLIYLESAHIFKLHVCTTLIFFFQIHPMMTEPTDEWKNSAPKRLLLQALANGDIPLDWKLMGPKAVYEKYKSHKAFNGVQYNSTFSRRLLALRKLFTEQKDDADIDWRTCEAKQFLKKCFKDGRIPMENYSAKSVWETLCQDNSLFVGMFYNAGFLRRLRGVRDDLQKKYDRATDDLDAYKNFREIHPRKDTNLRGKPQWHGSAAQTLLKTLMKEGQHIGVRPKDLWAEKLEFQVFELKEFRDHIYSEKRLWKLHNYLADESRKKKEEQQAAEKKRRERFEVAEANKRRKLHHDQDK